MVHPNERRSSPALAGAGAPIIGEQTADDKKFDKNLAFDGWDISLGRNQYLGELVGQLPQSKSVLLIQQTNARNDKEYHLIVHQISPLLDDHFVGMGLKAGERVVLSGTPTSVFFNGMEFLLCQFNSIQGILRRRDGELFVGSKFGATAIADGAPTSKEA